MKVENTTTCTSCGKITIYANKRSWYNATAKLKKTGILRCQECAGKEGRLASEKKPTGRPKGSSNVSKKEVITDFIYKIEFPNKKVYIGRTDDFDRRMTEHKYNAFTKNLPNSLYRAFRKYGWDSATKKIIQETTSKKAKKLEESLIREHDSVRNGYNDTYVGGGGDQWAGRKDSDEYMNFVNKMKKLNTGENNGMFGKTHSEEAKAAQKEKAKGRFSLPWFIERNGEEEGTRKYKERGEALRNRQCLKGNNNPMKNKEVVAKNKQSRYEKITN